MHRKLPSSETECPWLSPLGRKRWRFVPSLVQPLGAKKIPCSRCTDSSTRNEIVDRPVRSALTNDAHIHMRYCREDATGHVRLSTNVISNQADQRFVIDVFIRSVIVIKIAGLNW